MPMFPLGSNNSPGSPSNPFPDAAALNAVYPTGGPHPAFTPAVANPLSPCGVTLAHWNGAKWVPQPGQLIAQWRGVGGDPVLQRTAAGLTIGAWSTVWAPTDIIDDWLICNPGERISSVVDMTVSDASSPSAEEHRYSIRAAPMSGGDVYGTILGAFGAANTGVRSLGGIEVYNTVVSGGTIVGTAGNAPSSIPANDGRGVRGSWAIGSTKPYIDLKPGATTNVITIYSVQIWAKG